MPLASAWCWCIWLLDIICHVKKAHKWVTNEPHSALSFEIPWNKVGADPSCLYYSSHLIFSSAHSFLFILFFFFTCDVDMRDVSWRPVRSEEEMFTGAPRWRRMLTFLSFSNPWINKQTRTMSKQEAQCCHVYRLCYIRERGRKWINSQD